MKIHEIFCENSRIIFVLFYDIHKENVFTINLEDGREAPFKASDSEYIFLAQSPNIVVINASLNDYFTFLFYYIYGS